MKQTQLIMGMPITVEIVDDGADDNFDLVFDYFKKVDARYSTYKSDSEISRINNGLPEQKWSAEMKSVLRLCERTRQETNGFFDITHDGKRDTSGLVKGWAINNAAHLLKSREVANFYIEAGGDIQTHGVDEHGVAWSVGIRNPFNVDEIIKAVRISNQGVATSGTYIRGQHIYNPLSPDVSAEDVASLTVIGPNIYEADRFATAVFAMGKDGIGFIESKPGFEGYMVTSDKMATYTSGFERYVA